MADAPHLLTPQDLDAMERTPPVLQLSNLWNLQHTLRAAWGERDGWQRECDIALTRAEAAEGERDEAQGDADKFWEERNDALTALDAARASLRDVQTYTHAFHSIGPRAVCTHGICANIRASLGESAGQDGG